MNKNAIFYYKPGSTDGHETTDRLLQHGRDHTDYKVC